ncbi:hypothetical protein [Parahaliea maris]|uniref:hypothetical protein n=1 Tax=Parahaliea maris TaxID=2716870 RepID=UPI00164FD6C6|nr:hypothetical protein [Parahaliea maris]
MQANPDTKTIDQFLAENPDVDVSRAWERSWGILTDIKARIAGRFPGLSLHPSCAGREYYTSPTGEFEGSYQAWSGPGVEWLVSSWLGNRKASILDMNATAFLDQQTDVPHFIMVFGTIPRLFFYFDLVPRRDIRTDRDYLERYYGGAANEDFLSLRGHPNFQWSVSHGTYMRALLSPSAQSLSAELTDGNIDILEDYAYRYLERWLGWLDNASPVPEHERASLQQYDHTVRRLGYELDPMNKLAEQVFGADEVDRMIQLRMGAQQMAAVGG